MPSFTTQSGTGQYAILIDIDDVNPTTGIPNSPLELLGTAQTGIASRLGLFYFTLAWNGAIYSDMISNSMYKVTFNDRKYSIEEFMSSQNQINY